MRPLQNCHILYTRAMEHLPAFQAEITALGGIVWHLPLMDTHPLILSPSQKQLISTAEILIFPSVNAVRHLFSQYLPLKNQQYVAIGEKTAMALKSYQNKVLTAPSPFNSEALLSTWQPKGKRIIIINAEGGRKLLFERLQHSNAVQEVFCYQRFNPSTCYPKDFPLPNVITIASKATLDNLLAIIPQPLLKLLQYQTCIAAISAAVARYTAQQGFARCISAESAVESDQIEHICRWWNQNKELFP